MSGHRYYYLSFEIPEELRHDRPTASPDKVFADIVNAANADNELHLTDPINTALFHIEKQVPHQLDVINHDPSHMRGIVRIKVANTNGVDQHAMHRRTVSLSENFIQPKNIEKIYIHQSQKSNVRLNFLGTAELRSDDRTTVYVINVDQEVRNDAEQIITPDPLSKSPRDFAHMHWH